MVHLQTPVVIILLGAGKRSDVVVGRGVEQRRRVERGDLGGKRADHAGGNLVARKRGAGETARTIRSRARRIVDGGRPLGEVAAQKRRSGNGLERWGGSLAPAE